jgi:hypothetical protein
MRIVYFVFYFKLEYYLSCIVAPVTLRIRCFLHVFLIFKQKVKSSLIREFWLGGL